MQLLGDGTVSDMLWARPAVTVLGIDCPPVVGSAAAIVPKAAARLNLRIPPGLAPDVAREGARWRTSAEPRPGVSTSPSRWRPPARRSGPPPTDRPTRRWARRCSRPTGRRWRRLGQGGSIPLCNVFTDTYPDAEIILMGVEEPQALIHAPNESVDPREISAMALTEALFLQRYAAASS